MNSYLALFNLTMSSFFVLKISLALVCDSSGCRIKDKCLLFVLKVLLMAKIQYALTRIADHAENFSHGYYWQCRLRSSELTAIPRL